jgi:type IV pilus assembly protein PilM
MGNSAPLFYTDKPLFGLDIGHGSIKVMQLSSNGKQTTIDGYGTIKFDISAIENGVIVKPNVLADALHELHHKKLAGQITARRVAMAIPTYRAFSRSIQLPKLSPAELLGAVQLEIEQYVPIPVQDLYLDYTITGEDAQNYQLFVVAVPKKIVDSYVSLINAIGLEVVLIEPTMAACARFFAKSDSHSNLASVLIDFGSKTADISIFNKTILATSTAPAGGLVFTEAIRDCLKVTLEEAGDIKTRHGLDLSKYQKKVQAALEPPLQMLVGEMRRMLRYYDERYGSKDGISQIVVMGGGSNMPSLSNYLTDNLKIPVRTHSHPWALFKYHTLRPPMEADRLMYATVAGLSLVKPSEIFTT